MGQKDLIFTNHARERMRQRRITESEAWATWRNPDNERYAASKNAWIYYKTFGKNKLEVVVAKNNRGENIVVSVWSKPVYTQAKQSFLSFLIKKIFRG